MTGLSGLVALVLATTLAATLAPTAAAEARPAADRAGTASWRGLDVWHLTSTSVQGRPTGVAIEFKGNRLDYPYRAGVAAIAATADTAIVQLVDNGQGSGSGRLVELPATGEAGGVLERHLVGTPIADPNGHVAFWSTKRADGVHVVALDTTSGTKVLGPPVARFQRVFAAEGSTAYVVGRVLTADPTVTTWTPGQATLTELPAGFDHGGIVSDVSGERVLSFDLDDGLYVTDRTGTLLRTLPLFFGTFSPDAAHVVGLRGNFVALYETDTGTKVPLVGLRGRRPSLARWSPGGVLVVDTVPRHSSGDDAEPVLSFACTPTDGRCRLLPGRLAQFFHTYLPSDALGQFVGYLPGD